MKASDRDLVLRFGELGFVWRADSRRIELVQASDEGVPAPEKPAAIALLEPYHYLEGMKNVQREEADFRIFCEEFLQGMATAEIVDETPEAQDGGIGVTDAQVSPRLDAIREGMAQIRHLSEHEGDEAISWGDAIVAAVVAAYNHDVKDPGSAELGGVATAVANLLGIHAGELHTDEQIEARILGHPAARAYFWLRQAELERVNAGEVVEIGPFKVSATALDEPSTSAEIANYPLLGVPLGEIDALTLDGAHWLEVFGRPKMWSPSGGPVLKFRVAQAPGGKKGKTRFGVAQGDLISVPIAAIRGVQRKGGFGPPSDALAEPLAVQPLCECGHQYDHHSHRPGHAFCSHPTCDCEAYRPKAGG